MARTINWREVLSESRVPFIERGPNVKRGELNIKCPFCGSADPSYHMGLNQENGWWACWRNQSHRGKSPVRLLMAVLRIPFWEAQEMAGLGEGYVDPEGFSALAARLLRGAGAPDQALPRAEFLQMPDDWRRITPGGFTWRHERYLRERRGFGKYTPLLIELYGLHGATSAEWGERILMPYRFAGQLVTWTGRAITGHPIRYKDLSIDESILPPKQTLYNYDATTKPGRVLNVVEGPVDALKLDMFGRTVGVRAAALSTNSMTDDQLYMISEIAERFDWVVFILDTASALGVVDSMRMRQQVAHIRNAVIDSTPFGLKDPGELSPQQAIQFTDEQAKDRYARAI